jgi:hypothetical protein
MASRPYLKVFFYIFALIYKLLFWYAPDKKVDKKALPLVMGEKYTTTCAYLDNCRRKRNVSEYDAVGTISETEAKDLLAFANDLKKEVLEWLTREHPSLLSG